MKLSRESIYNYIKLQREKYYEEAKKHPSSSEAYRENIESAYTLLILERDLQEMENE